MAMTMARTVAAASETGESTARAVVAPSCRDDNTSSFSTFIFNLLWLFMGFAAAFTSIIIYKRLSPRFSTKKDILPSQSQIGKNNYPIIKIRREDQIDKERNSLKMKNDAVIKPVLERRKEVSFKTTETFQMKDRETIQFRKNSQEKESYRKAFHFSNLNINEIMGLTERKKNIPSLLNRAKLRLKVGILANIEIFSMFGAPSFEIQ